MSALPNRRDDEVRRQLDTPHPMVPPDLPARAAARGRLIVRRRRITHAVLWTLLLAAVITGIVLAVLLWPDNGTSQVPDAPGGGAWWPVGG